MSSCEEEVLKLGKKLSKAIEAQKTNEALELLTAIAQQPVNVDILTKTRIGATVNQLRKNTSDEKLAKKAKSLVKEWKSMLDGDNGKTPNKSASSKEKPSTPIPASIKRNESTASNLSNSGESSNSSSRPAVQVTASFSGSFPPKHLQSDDMRIKACEMLLKALKVGELPEGTLDPEELAIKIEDKLFVVHKGSGDKYRAALRSRVFNLNKNVALRENALTGVVAPEKFAVMTTEEMASDDIKKQREKFTQDAIRDAQISIQQGTPSDMFKCGKCQKKNCTYTQLQTRSADEPMTTFVFCLECGNRWKFC